MKEIYSNSGYIAEPHGAVGYLGLKKYKMAANEFGVFLETAHPVKFLDVVEETLPVKVAIPAQIQRIINNKMSVGCICHFLIRYIQLHNL